MYKTIGLMRIKGNVSGLVAIGLCQKLPKSIERPIIFSKPYPFGFYRFFIFSWNIIDFFIELCIGFCWKKDQPDKKLYGMVGPYSKRIYQRWPKKNVGHLWFFKNLLKMTAASWSSLILIATYRPFRVSICSPYLPKTTLSKVKSGSYFVWNFRFSCSFLDLWSWK